MKIEPEHEKTEISHSIMNYLFLMTSSSIVYKMLLSKEDYNILKKYVSQFKKLSVTFSKMIKCPGAGIVMFMNELIIETIKSYTFVFVDFRFIARSSYDIFIYAVKLSSTYRKVSTESVCPRYVSKDSPARPVNTLTIVLLTTALKTWKGRYFFLQLVKAFFQIYSRRIWLEVLRLSNVYSIIWQPSQAMLFDSKEDK